MRKRASNSHYPRDCAVCGERVKRDNGFFMMLLWLNRGPVSVHHEHLHEFMQELR